MMSNENRKRLKKEFDIFSYKTHQVKFAGTSTLIRTTYNQLMVCEICSAMLAYLVMVLGIVDFENEL